MRVKLSINDAERRHEVHAVRLELLMQVLGAKPLGPWRWGMDTGTTLTSAYYATTFEREYEWNGPIEELKKLMIGAEYIRVLQGYHANSPFVISRQGSSYLKVCDIDVYYHRGGFLGGWFKVHSRSLAKQHGLRKEDFVLYCIGCLEALLTSLPTDVKTKFEAASERLLRQSANI